MGDTFGSYFISMAFLQFFNGPPLCFFICWVKTHTEEEVVELSAEEIWLYKNGIVDYFVDQVTLTHPGH